MCEQVNTIAEEVKVHPFERSGLGKAPFRFVGMKEKVHVAGDHVQAGGTCMHCGMGIRYCYWIESADGRQSYVGSTCIGKTGDARLVPLVESEERKRKRAQRDERARLARVATRKSLESIRERAAQLPHPNEHMAARGLTLADYGDYAVSRCSDRAAREMVAKIVRLVEEAAS